jgi:hypothetical protein
MSPSASRRIAVSVSLLTLIAAVCVTSALPSRHDDKGNLQTDLVMLPIDALAVDSLVYDDRSKVLLPAYARRIHGRRIRITGIMFPTLKEHGLTSFEFIPETRRRPRAIMDGSPLPLHALIPVTTVAGHTESYEERPITIEGTFEIDIQAENGQVLSLYRIKNARVVEAPSHLKHNTAVVLIIC